MADSKYTNAPVNPPDIYYTPISGTVNPTNHDQRNCLCVCEIPDGRILLVWSDGANFRGLLFNDISEVLNDNVAASSSGTLILATGSIADNSSCFTVGGNVFLNLNYYDGSNVVNRLYIANNPADPLGGGWSVRYTFGTAGPDRLPAMTTGVAGIPMVIGSRWILPTPVVGNFLGNGFYRMGVWTSTNDGVSFTNVINLGFYIVGGSYMQMMGGQMMTLPDGRIMLIGWGAIDGVRRAFSSDDGANWSHDNPASEGSMGPYQFQAILNNGVESFAARDPAPGSFYSIDSDTQVLYSLGTFPSNARDYNFKAIWLPQAQVMVYCFNPNRIAAQAAGWIIDSIAM